MPKPPKLEALRVEELGDLGRYTDAELLQLREKLIANEARIHQESTHLQRRLKEINIARSDLQQELGENARAMRAVKHAISQNARADFARPSTHSAKPVRRRAGGLRADP
jgi:tRNA isopentenyl-2-thiomethyl-A-37 hydroxylase MiaE